MTMGLRKRGTAKARDCETEGQWENGRVAQAKARAEPQLLPPVHKQGTRPKANKQMFLVLFV